MQSFVFFESTDRIVAALGVALELEL